MKDLKRSADELDALLHPDDERKQGDEGAKATLRERLLKSASDLSSGLKAMFRADELKKAEDEEMVADEGEEGDEEEEDEDGDEGEQTEEGGTIGRTTVKDPVKSAANMAIEEDMEQRGGDGLSQKSAAARGALYDDLLNDEDFGDAVEASAALEHLAGTLGKAFGDLLAEVQTLRRAQGEMAKSVALVCEAQASLIKSAGMHPVRSVAPGIMGQFGDVVSEASNGALSKTDIMVRLEKAMHDGKVSANDMAKFQTRPLEVLGRLPADVLKAYDIPATWGKDKK
jgi:hypothetical protein